MRFTSRGTADPAGAGAVIADGAARIGASRRASRGLASPAATTVAGLRKSNGTAGTRGDAVGSSLVTRRHHALSQEDRSGAAAPIAAVRPICTTGV